jgi:hypothetical protein
MPVIGAVVFFGMGLLQLAAIQAGLTGWLGLHWIIAIPVSLFLAYVPVVGTVLGCAGAINVWHWDVLWALLLFFGGLALALGFGGVASLMSYLGGRRGA